MGILTRMPDNLPFLASPPARPFRQGFTSPTILSPALGSSGWIDDTEEYDRLL